MDILDFSPCSRAALCVTVLQGFGGPEICVFLQVNLLWCGGVAAKLQRETFAGLGSVTTKFKIQFCKLCARRFEIFADV